MADQEIKSNYVQRKARLDWLLAELKLTQGQAAAFLSRVTGEKVQPGTVRRWLAVRPEAVSTDDHFSRPVPGWVLVILEFAVAANEEADRVHRELAYCRSRQFSGTKLDLEGVELGLRKSALPGGKNAHAVAVRGHSTIPAAMNVLRVTRKNVNT